MAGRDFGPAGQNFAFRDGAAAGEGVPAAVVTTVPIDGIDGARPAPSPRTGLTHPADLIPPRAGAVDTFTDFCLECFAPCEGDYCTRHKDHGVTICEHCATNVAQVTLDGYHVCASPECLKWGFGR